MKYLDLSKHTPEIHEDQYLGRGAFHRVHKATVHVGTHKVAMVVRRIITPGRRSWQRTICDLDAREDLAKMRFDDGRRIPVLPTERVHPETHDVYATDLTDNGTKYVLSSRNDVEDDPRAALESPLKYEKEAALAIMEELKYFAEQCAEKGIKFHENALFFIIDKKTLETKILFGDCKFDNLSRPPMEKDLIVKCNAQAAFDSALSVLASSLSVYEIKAFFSTLAPIRVY